MLAKAQWLTLENTDSHDISDIYKTSAAYADSHDISDIYKTSAAYADSHDISDIYKTSAAYTDTHKKLNTVNSAHKVTSIKQAPVLKDPHFLVLS